MARFVHRPSPAWTLSTGLGRTRHAEARGPHGEGMDDIRFTSQLNLLGFERWDVERLLLAGQLERVRRGAYSAPLAPDAANEDRHRRLIAATVPQLDSGAVLSHSSAAVLHGFPTWRPGLDHVHITRPRSTGGQRRRIVHVHVAPLPPGPTPASPGPPRPVRRPRLGRASSAPLRASKRGFARLRRRAKSLQRARSGSGAPGGRTGDRVGGRWCPVAGPGDRVGGRWSARAGPGGPGGAGGGGVRPLPSEDVAAAGERSATLRRRGTP